MPVKNYFFRDEIEGLRSRLESAFHQKEIPVSKSELSLAESCLTVGPICRSPSPIPNYITNEGGEASPRAPSPISPRVKRILIK